MHSSAGADHYRRQRLDWTEMKAGSFERRVGQCFDHAFNQSRFGTLLAGYEEVGWG